jgi:hypothetical protein
MRKFTLALAVAALAAPALAQPVTQNTLTGNECWSAGQGPGGPSTFICSGLVTSSQTVITSTMAASLAIPNNVADLIITAQPANSTTITLPASPVANGAIVEVVNGTISNFVTNVCTIQPAAGQTLVGGNVAITTLAAGASREFRYVLATNSWYPLR